MEELQATALGLLNNHLVSIKEKINSFNTFREEAMEQLNCTSSERSKKAFQDYIAWLDRQLKVLNNNGQHIVA